MNPRRKERWNKMPPVKMRGDGRMAKNPKRTMLRLLSYMGKHWGTLIVVGLCVVFSAIAQAASVLTGTDVDTAASAQAGSNN